MKVAKASLFITEDWQHQQFLSLFSFRDKRTSLKADERRKKPLLRINWMRTRLNCKTNEEDSERVNWVLRSFPSMKRFRWPSERRWWILKGKVIWFETMEEKRLFSSWSICFNGLLCNANEEKDIFEEPSGKTWLSETLQDILSRLSSFYFTRWRSMTFPTGKSATIWTWSKVSILISRWEGSLHQTRSEEGMNDSRLLSSRLTIAHLLLQLLNERIVRREDEWLIFPLNSSCWSMNSTWRNRPSGVFQRCVFTSIFLNALKRS